MPRSPFSRPQNGKTTVKCPKIQRLVTPQVLQRKRRRAAIKKERITRKKTEAAEYHKLLVQVRGGGLGAALLAVLPLVPTLRPGSAKAKGSRLALVCSASTLSACRACAGVGHPGLCPSRARSDGHLAEAAFLFTPRLPTAAPQGAARAPLRVPGQEARPACLCGLQGGVSASPGRSSTLSRTRPGQPLARAGPGAAAAPRAAGGRRAAAAAATVAHALRYAPALKGRRVAPFASNRQ